VRAQFKKPELGRTHTTTDCQPRAQPKATRCAADHTHRSQAMTSRQVIQCCARFGGDPVLAKARTGRARRSMGTGELRSPPTMRVRELIWGVSIHGPHASRMHARETRPFDYATSVACAVPGCSRCALDLPQSGYCRGRASSRGSGNAGAARPLCVSMKANTGASCACICSGGSLVNIWSAPGTRMSCADTPWARSAS